MSVVLYLIGVILCSVAIYPAKGWEVCKRLERRRHVQSAPDHHWGNAHFEVTVSWGWGWAEVSLGYRTNMHVLLGYSDVCSVSGWSPRSICVIVRYCIWYYFDFMDDAHPHVARAYRRQLIGVCVCVWGGELRVWSDTDSIGILWDSYACAMCMPPLNHSHRFTNSSTGRMAIT